MSIQAMKQALEALEDPCSDVLAIRRRKQAITALRAAIAEEEKGEPVAWLVKFDARLNGLSITDKLCVWHKEDAPKQIQDFLIKSVEPLYTAPQPAIPADVIRQAQAQALRDAADRLELQNWDSAADELRRMADELERKA